ncbi:hypothetical protein EXE48_18145 [Halorubrum sp. ASP1]|uniref:Uncharacterized protein n=2 Tax=Halorubrum distributum TaxID=29283 RepID=M0EUE2_9EURY|nr:hypothetical protein [Halorubrum distributum]ELZ50718.1 hypothetical protein C465_05231 [Halorubrum distributum JCM 9100]ELZ52858.1 hypothetical protein C466_09882 [Halorubrum distributum JCM 10118]TKX39148.1 hypothetical protein EXE41_18760 [Halorubrum sp. SD690R]TKX57242.1 hypothetical protein EXE48_18145 [Halorubrum sp. ASP1]
MTLKDIAKDPLTQVSAGLGAIAAVLNPEVVWALTDALIASGPQLFSAISVGALTLPQVLPPSSTGEWAVVAAALVFLAYLGQQIWSNIDREV